MLSMEEQKVLVEQILGSPLPQLDEIYMQGAKLYDTTAPNRFITPYLLSLLYTPFEMKLVLQLPGSAEEVAEKLGLETEPVREALDRLLRYGRLLPLKKGRPGYAPSVDVMTIRDQIGMAYNAQGLDWNQEMPLFRLMEAWRQMPNPPQALIDATHGSFRVIPKYASIKHLPGVMYCETAAHIISASALELRPRRLQDRFPLRSFPPPNQRLYGPRKQDVWQPNPYS